MDSPKRVAAISANIPAFNPIANILLRDFDAIRSRSEFSSRDQVPCSDWRVANRQPTSVSIPTEKPVRNDKEARAQQYGTGSGKAIGNRLYERLGGDVEVLVKARQATIRSLAAKVPSSRKWPKLKLTKNQKRDSLKVTAVLNPRLIVGHATLLGEFPPFMIQACFPLKAEGGTVTLDQVERTRARCQQIEIERDQHQFSQLIARTE
jgi:hypothetical protein